MVSGLIVAQRPNVVYAHILTLRKRGRERECKRGEQLKAAMMTDHSFVLVTISQIIDKNGDRLDNARGATELTGT